MLPGLQQKVNGGDGVARRPPIRGLYLQFRAENFAVPAALRMGLQLQVRNRLAGTLQAVGAVRGQGAKFASNPQGPSPTLIEVPRNKARGYSRSSMASEWYLWA